MTTEIAQVCTCPNDCDCDGLGPLFENNAQTCTDHEKCCRFLLCSHPACCGYYGKVLSNPPGQGSGGENRG